eukprot:4251886-Prymnesium_polylepis.1
MPWQLILFIDLVLSHHHHVHASSTFCLVICLEVERWQPSPGVVHPSQCSSKGHKTANNRKGGNAGCKADDADGCAPKSLRKMRLLQG